jgi:predicted dehydrogenase
MTAALVVGYGSIGRRHVRVLNELGCETAVVSRRPLDFVPHFATVSEALSTKAADYVVVANETSAHRSAVEELLTNGYAGKLLVEKPLGQLSDTALSAAFEIAAVGYNLRFHPVMMALADAIADQRLLAMQAYCGQWLPDWRPGTDYSASYSADAARGGGVLRDLSHELDYVLWLGGSWRRVAGFGGRIGPLDIRSDDYWSLLLELDGCPSVSVQINYLDRPGRRQVIVNTADHTYSADLIRGTLECDGRTQTFDIEADHTYRAQHRAILAGDTARLCHFAQGHRVMQLIAASEKAASQGCWISA